MHRFLEWLAASQQFFQALGWLGILAYAGVILGVQVVLIPLAPLGIAAGVFFGFWGGFFAVMLGTGLGAAVNFIISRHFAREALTRRLGGNVKFRLIDAAIGQQGWKIVALLRFCPLPYGFANYCYGLTAIPFWPYLITTLVTIIPANALFVWLGATAQEGLASLLGGGRARQPAEYVLLGVGIVAAFVALAVVGRIAHKAVVRAHDLAPKS